MIALMVTAPSVACIQDPHVPRQQSVGLPTAPPPTAPTPTSGTLRVTVATTGAELAPYGYAVMIDGAIASLTAANAVTTLDLAPGRHEVRIGGIPVECVEGIAGTFRTVNVIAGRETLESFAIACTAPAKIPPDTLPPVRVSVTVVSTGFDIEPGGYFVDVERRPEEGTAYRTGSELAANDSISLTLPTGSYTAGLVAVAPNCTVSPAFVPFEAKSADVLVQFTVTCAAIPETQGIRVTAVTTGADPDSDGYTVSVENDLDMNGESFAGSRTVDSNGSIMLPKVPAGYYVVRLTGVAKNCIVVPAVSAWALVAPNETTSIKYQVLCFTPVNSS